MLFSNIVLDVVEVDAIPVEGVSVPVKMKSHPLANVHPGGGDLSIHRRKIQSVVVGRVNLNSVQCNPGNGI